MSELRKANTDDFYFITFVVVGWIDVFTRSELCDIITDNLNYCIENKNVEIYSFVIMPSHIHLIARSSVDEKLSNFIRDFKSFSAKRIINEMGSESFESRKEWLLYMFRFFANGNARNKEFQFWQQTNHPTMLYSNGVIEQKNEYITQNPVNAGIVTAPEYYRYSSANPDCDVKLTSWN
jgi:putative transposase